MHLFGAIAIVLCLALPSALGDDFDVVSSPSGGLTLGTSEYFETTAQSFFCLIDSTHSVKTFAHL
jgi:hypothetical protein